MIARRPVLAAVLGLVALASAGPARPPPTQAVATDHPEATRVAQRILQRGGNAADAAAAAMLALGAANPASSGFGGGGFATYYRASDGSVSFLDFRERAPSAATATMFVEAERARPDSSPSTVGGLAVGVPGEPAGIAKLVRDFGRLPLSVVVAPAARLAERGVAPSEFLRRVTTPETLRLFGLDRNLRRFVHRDALANRIRQPALAAVLRAFGRSGPDAVYRGRIAAEIVRDVRAAGGILTESDLADYAVAVRTPLRETHFGLTWVTAPPPSAGGATMLASVDFAERARLARGASDADFAHTLIESFKGPYLDRQAAFGDPDHVDVPLAELASESRRASRADLFDAARARPSSDYALPLPGGTARTPDGGGTTHLCIVDREGNVASVTTTVNLTFGARFTAAGVLMNDEMDDFARAVGEANAFGLVGGARNLPAPGKRPVSSMLPTIVLGPDGRPVLCIGAGGGSRIPTATTQVALRILVRGESPTDAIAAPRVHHQAVPDVVSTETLVPAPSSLLEALGARGHAFATLEYVAIVQLIRIDGGVPIAAADPRKRGLAIAF